MRVLITGISGFIGRHLSKKLIERGHEVHGLENENGGVLNKKLVEQKVRGAKVIIHLAALTAHKDIADSKFETLETNFLGTKNILDAFIKSKSAKKFLYASTGKVYGNIIRLPISEEHPTNPLNVLGKSKLITEKLIDFYASASLPSTKLGASSTSNKEFIIFRIFNVYGPGQREYFLIPTILSQVNSGKREVILGDIKAKRDYIYIDDVVGAFVQAIEKRGSVGFSTFNICTGKSSNAKEIINQIEKIKGIKIKLKSDSRKIRSDEMEDEYGSFRNAKKTFGWEPKTSLNDGLKKIIKGGPKALVLAGGEGRRMQKKIPKVPKLLIPIKGKPFLDYLIDYLSKYDCSKMVLSTGYLGDQIEKYVRQKKYNMQVSIAFEKKPLGTGGAINFSERMFDDDFFLLFGDVYTEVDLKKMLDFHRSRNAVITAVVHESRHPEDSNLIEFDSTGKVTKVLIKPHGRSGKNLYNLAALYILSPRLSRYLPRKASYDFERDLFFKLVNEKIPIYAYNTGETIMDFGTPERLMKLKKILRK